MDVTLPRETTEFLPIPVTQDGNPVTDYQVALTRWPARPTVWTAATVVGLDAGVVAASLLPGTYQVWVKVGGVVVAAGSITVR